MYATCSCALFCYNIAAVSKGVEEQQVPKLKIYRTDVSKYRQCIIQGCKNGFPYHFKPHCCRTSMAIHKVNILQFLITVFVDSDSTIILSKKEAEIVIKNYVVPFGCPRSSSNTTSSVTNVYNFQSTVNAAVIDDLQI